MVHCAMFYRYDETLDGIFLSSVVHLKVHLE